jgi:hypothetical protein
MAEVDSLGRLRARVGLCCDKIATHAGDVIDAVCWAVGVLGPSCREAVSHGVAFELAAVARMLFLACGGVVPIERIARALADQLPPADSLGEPARTALARALASADAAAAGGPLPAEFCYNEAFLAVEIDAWLYGLTTHPGGVFPALAFLVIKELGIAFRAALMAGLFIDVPEVARRFALATHFVVLEEELALAVCAQFQSPSRLIPEQRDLLYRILRRVEEAYPGLELAPRLERLERARRGELMSPQALVSRQAAGQQQVGGFSITSDDGTGGGGEA